MHTHKIYKIIMYKIDISQHVKYHSIHYRFIFSCMLFHINKDALLMDLVQLLIHNQLIKYTYIIIVQFPKIWRMPSSSKMDITPWYIEIERRTGPLLDGGRATDWCSSDRRSSDQPFNRPTDQRNQTKKCCNGTIWSLTSLNSDSTIRSDDQLWRKNIFLGPMKHMLIKEVATERIQIVSRKTDVIYERLRRTEGLFLQIR